MAHPRPLDEERRTADLPLLAGILVLVSATLAVLPWKGAKIAAAILAMTASAVGIAGHLRKARRHRREAGARGGT